MVQGTEKDDDITSLPRRKLLSRAAIALPMIATVPSGAALARSSNLVHVSDEPWTDADGTAYCLETTGLDYDGGTAVDLGTSAPSIAPIPPHDYFKDPETPVSLTEMCKQGGEYYYLDGAPQTMSVRAHGRGPTHSTSETTAAKTYVSVPKGAFVSATAMSSFAGSISITNI